MIKCTNLYKLLTSDLAQQTPMHPIIEAAKIRMTERAVVITMAMMQLSMTLMLLHFDTMEKNK